MKRGVLAIDCDDVLIEFNRAFIAFMNKQIGTSVTFEEHHTYQFESIYDRTYEEMMEFVELFLAKEHQTILPMAGAPEALHALIESGFTLQLVTSRCESMQQATLELLTEHKLDRMTAYHFTNAVTRRYPERKRSKAQVCSEINAIALIDDAAHHANEVAKTCGIPVFMPDKPWNQNIPLAPEVERVFSWPETVQKLTQQFAK